MIRQFAQKLIKSTAQAPLSLQIPSYSFNKSSKNYEDMLRDQEKQNRASDELSRNYGMTKFMQRTYITTGLSIVGALSTSFAVMSIPALAASMMPLAVAGCISTLVGFIGTSFTQPTDVVEEESIPPNQKVSILKTVNSPFRHALHGLGVVGLGLSAAPLFALAAMVNPSILPTCIGLTTAIFGGASLIAYSQPAGQMLKYGRVLTGGLFGLIGLQIVGMLTTLVMGPNPFSMMLFRADTYLGIALFSAFIAYDTHAAMQMYQMGRADHLGMAGQFILDFWNILVRLVSIFINRD